MPVATEILIVGGGIIGLACARALDQAGFTVGLMDAGEPGQQASAAAAGMLAPLAEVPEPGPFFDACRSARNLWRSWGPELQEESGLDIDYATCGPLVPAM